MSDPRAKKILSRHPDIKDLEMRAAALSQRLISLAREANAVAREAHAVGAELTRLNDGSEPLGG